MTKKKLNAQPIGREMGDARQRNAPIVERRAKAMEGSESNGDGPVSAHPWHSYNTVYTIAKAGLYFNAFSLFFFGIQFEKYAILFVEEIVFERWMPN